jgi:hypothetical protein
VLLDTARTCRFIGAWALPIGGWLARKLRNVCFGPRWPCSGWRKAHICHELGHDARLEYVVAVLQRLAELALRRGAGTVVAARVQGPYGGAAAVEDEPSKYEHMLVVAGGIGITAVLPLLRHLELRARASSEVRHHSDGRPCPIRSQKPFASALLAHQTCSVSLRYGCLDNGR